MVPWRRDLFDLSGCPAFLLGVFVGMLLWDLCGNVGPLQKHLGDGQKVSATVSIRICVTKGMRFNPTAVT